MAKPKSINVQVDVIRKNLEEKILQTQNAKFIELIAKLAKEILYRRVKSGYGVTDGDADAPAKKKLDRLEKSTIAQRKARYAAKRGTFGSYFDPKKSNLTDTGQMLDAIEYSIMRGSFKLTIADTKRKNLKGYKTKKSKMLTNLEVAGHVTDNGRPFFALTEDEQRILERRIEVETRKILRSK
jgi:hypothetical protein